MVEPRVRRAVGAIRRGGEIVGHCVCLRPGMAVTCAHVLSHETERPTQAITIEFPNISLTISDARVSAWVPFDQNNPTKAKSDIAILTWDLDQSVLQNSEASNLPGHVDFPEGLKRPLGAVNVICLEYLNQECGETKSGKTVQDDAGLIRLESKHGVLGVKGMSGTGIFHENGERLLGIINAKAKQDQQHDCYAIPAEWIHELIANSFEKIDELKANPTLEFLLERWTRSLEGNHRSVAGIKIAQKVIDVINSGVNHIEASGINQIRLLYSVLQSSRDNMEQSLANIFDGLLGVIEDFTTEQRCGLGQTVDLSDEQVARLNNLHEELLERTNDRTAPEVETLTDIIDAAIAFEALDPLVISDQVQVCKRSSVTPIGAILLNFELFLGQALRCFNGSQFAQPGVSFRDGEKLPIMTVLPAGVFTMGSPDNEEGRSENESPQQEIGFGKLFAMARYATTFDEWDFCVTEGGCNYRPGDAGWGRGNRPVINVSWEDAQEYVDWLNANSDGGYALPSEAQWEYAARADTETPFHTGEQITTDQANFDGNYMYNGSSKGIYRRQTVPVGSFAPNNFGLYDMHGNVWEWMQDYYRDSLSGQPIDGSAYIDGEDRFRVLRGGSWSSRPRGLRSAYRSGDSSAFRSYSGGFRITKTL